MTPRVKIIPADRLPEPRSTPGTPADRRDQLSWRIKLRYAIALGIAIAAAAFAGSAFVAAHDARRSAHQAKELVHQIKPVAQDAKQLAANAHALALRVHHDEQASLANRLTNVSTWCEHISALQQILTSYVAAERVHDSQLPPLTLRPLDCAALEHATAATTR